MSYSSDELEMIQSIREILEDDNIDELDAIEAYIEIMSK